ncbi:MAG: hypothetical protein EAZ91_21165 [Cytophagales bacterium]|nr:MAG: hypothetical protein EAZ91_21165 [Cytophagales bacterium]
MTVFLLIVCELYAALAGLMNESVGCYSINNSAFASRRVTVQADTLEQPDRRATTTVTPNDYYAEQAARMDRPESRRAGFALLFLIGVVLGVVATWIAWTLALANYGIAAALVFIVGLGAQIGGIFFVSRAFERVIKPWREMDHTDRRRINRRFLRIWLGLWGVLFLLALANSR